ncbi:MAG: cytochrome c biogenesis protein CcsA [Gemmatimonadaceae bacterium]|nr:cytochrome c biogenesis protein CcsA [Gemmatimonadaceae bacterium]
MILVGELSLWVALLMAAWGAVVSFAGGALQRRDLAASGRRALYVAFAALVVATSGVVTALIERDFSLAYVAMHTNLALPQAYAVSALWSGPAGAMLVWALALAGCVALLAPGGATRDRSRGPWTAGVSATLLLFVLLVVCVQANPYERLSWRAPDGRGLDPRLLQPVMVLHQPLLILGYVALSMPFVLTMGGLLARRLDAAWASSARRWALAGWTCLAGGLLLGARGSAAASPTGGWGWSSGEGVALGVWVVATGLLHTLARTPARGLLVKWNSILSALVALGALAGAYALAASGGAPAFRAAWVGGGVVCAAAAVWSIASRAPTVTVEPSAAGPRRRRVGEFVAHAAALVLVVALAAGAFSGARDMTLATGQEAQVADPFGHVWRFVSQGTSRYSTADHDVVALSLDASRDGIRQGLLVAEQWQYRDALGDSLYAPITRVGVRSSPTLDARAVLLAASADEAQVRITFVPLAVWAWIGGGLVVLGGVLALWPRTTPAGRPSTRDADA